MLVFVVVLLLVVSHSFAVHLNVYAATTAASCPILMCVVSYFSTKQDMKLIRASTPRLAYRFLCCQISLSFCLLASADVHDGSDKESGLLKWQSILCPSVYAVIIKHFMF